MSGGVHGTSNSKIHYVTHIGGFGVYNEVILNVLIKKSYKKNVLKAYFLSKSPHCTNMTVTYVTHIGGFGVYNEVILNVLIKKSY